MLGIWSYSIYLWQQPFFHYGVKDGEIFPFAGPVLAAVAVGVGVLSFQFIEDPIRAYLNQRWSAVSDRSKSWGAVEARATR